MMDAALAELANIDILPHLLALAIAYALALPIGWNREREERSAGLRTSPLVALASCGFVEAAETLSRDTPEAMARVIEGVITGIGFIGGGAILKHGTTVLGTATAASLWITGAIGVAAGLGSYGVAIVLSAITTATLLVLSPGKQSAEVAAEAEPQDDAGSAPGTGTA